MSKFVAHLWKMKYIRRWGLMRNTEPENLHEHSWQVAIVAHLLSTIHNDCSPERVDPERIATLALFHELSEAIVGDVPTPIKYFNPQTAQAIHALEADARSRLLRSLPAGYQSAYRDLIEQTNAGLLETTLVKAADRICAYIKCRQELKFGNRDFELAERAVRARLEEMGLKEVDIFLSRFLDSMDLTIDELNETNGD